MKKRLINRLKDFGYQYDSKMDASLIEFTLAAVENKIKNCINAETVPEGLAEVEIDMACGEFMKLKKSMGQLAGYDFSPVAETIKEGDTSITFQKGASAEQRFDAAIDAMINGHDKEFARYRRLVW